MIRFQNGTKKYTLIVIICLKDIGTSHTRFPHKTEPLVFHTEGFQPVPAKESSNPKQPAREYDFIPLFLGCSCNFESLVELRFREHQPKSVALRFLNPLFDPFVVSQ